MTPSVGAPVEAVVFDLGGTCLEILHDVVASAIRAHAHEPAVGWIPAGERRGRHTLEAAMKGGRAPDQAWRTFFDGMIAATGAPDAIHDAVFEDIAAYNRAHHLWGRVMPGMPDALAALAARGYRVAAVSNSDGRAAEHLARLDLLDAFEFVLDSRDEGVEKPDPRIFLRACERLGLPPGSCAYVGDVVAIDVLGARAAGLVPVLFDAYGSYDAGATDALRAENAAGLLALFPGRAA
jgi:putative hydrolase of the HAD superfamily